MITAGSGQANEELPQDFRPFFTPVIFITPIFEPVVRRLVQDLLIDRVVAQCVGGDGYVLPNHRRTGSECQMVARAWRFFPPPPAPTRHCCR